MRKFTLLLLSGLFLGFASYVEPNKCDPQIGDDSKKGPPGIKTVDLVYLNIKKLNQSVGYKTNYPYLIIKKESNQSNLNL